MPHCITINCFTSSSVVTHKVWLALSDICMHHGYFCLILYFRGSLQSYFAPFCPNETFGRRRMDNGPHQGHTFSIQFVCVAYWRGWWNSEVGIDQRPHRASRLLRKHRGPGAEGRPSSPFVAQLRRSAVSPPQKEIETEMGLRRL